MVLFGFDVGFAGSGGRTVSNPLPIGAVLVPVRIHLDWVWEGIRGQEVLKVNVVARDSDSE